MMVEVIDVVSGDVLAFIPNPFEGIDPDDESASEAVWESLTTEYGMDVGILER